MSIKEVQNTAVDLKRREFLLRLASILGVVSVAGLLWPFIRALFPSAVTRAAGRPIELDVSTLTVGEQRTVMWRGKPIWVIRRSDSAIAKLLEPNQQLEDPESKLPQQPPYAQNATRSLRPDILVLVAACTHLGCVPTYRPDPHTLDQYWPGGFFCSCHGSKFDLAGRVYQGMPAPTNLEVPPYYFKDLNTLVIGVHASSRVSEVNG